MFALPKLFDSGYYAKNNPDLASVLVNSEQLFNHFIQFGLNENRSFSPYVDLDFYAEKNPELATVGLRNHQQLLDHLITYGINEKRLFSPKADLNFYAAANPDLRTAGLTTGEQLFDHLINYGAKEGRQLISSSSSQSQGTPANTGLSQPLNTSPITIPQPPNIPQIPVPNVPSFTFTDSVASSDASRQRSSSSLDLDWRTTVWDWKSNKVGDTTLFKRNDGLNGVNVDWGTGSVAGRSDYFIAGMWNYSYFDANNTYKFRVKADDGFYLLVSPDGKNWKSLMNQWEYAYNDNNNYKTFKEYSFTPTTSGNHYVWAYVYEKDGAAYFDLSWDNGWDKNRGGLNYADGDTALQYMYEEMKNNAQSQVVSQIKNNNYLASNSGPSLFGGGAKSQALKDWFDKVNDNQDWDHKPKLASLLGLYGENSRKDFWPWEKDDDFAFPIWGDSEDEYFYDIWSNIHYGYVGKAAGFTDSELQSGAALNDYLKRNNDQKDVSAIGLGIQLWNETNGNPNRLTPELLREKIISNGSSLSRFPVNNGK